MYLMTGVYVGLHRQLMKTRSLLLPTCRLLKCFFNSRHLNNGQVQHQLIRQIFFIYCVPSSVQKRGTSPLSSLYHRHHRARGAPPWVVLVCIHPSAPLQVSAFCRAIDGLSWMICPASPMEFTPFLYMYKKRNAQGQRKQVKG